MKEALESDEVRGYMADCVEAAVSRELMRRGLGAGAGRRAAQDVLASGVPARRVSASGRAVVEAYWPWVYSEPDVVDASVDEPVEASEPVDPGVVEGGSAPLYSEEAVAARPELGSVGGRPSMGVVESGWLPERLARLDARTRSALGLGGVS